MCGGDRFRYTPRTREAPSVLGRRAAHVASSGAMLNPTPAAVKPATFFIIFRREILSFIKPLLCVMIPHSKFVKNCTPSIMSHVGVPKGATPLT
jgi:hypothetical protein